MTRRWKDMTTTRTKIVSGSADPARVEISIRLHVDDGGHASKASVNIPKRIAMSEAVFRWTVAEQLHRLADRIAGADSDDLLDPLAWPLIQFEGQISDEERALIDFDALFPKRRAGKRPNWA